MNYEEYEKAHRMGLKDFRNKVSKGAYPYLQVLDEMLSSYTDVSAEINIGLVDIPIDQIVGTKTAGRKNAFASNYMPLLDAGSEFAVKWVRLYNSHIEEGIREPVKVYEFMNRFYVLEGNKRVSVLKYCDAVTVPAFVTRLLPPQDDSVENKIYYEFLDFYEKTGINYLDFSQPGNYLKITKQIGIDPESEWTDQEKTRFRSSYLQFTKAFEKKEGNKLSLTPGDAFLIYLGIYGYEMQDKGPLEIQDEIAKIWNDFVFYPQKPEVKLIMDTEEEVVKRKHLVDLILPQNTAPLKVAFIHSKTAETSSWIYGHELGRGHLDECLAGQVITTAYFHADSEEEQADCFEQAIADGNTVIFSTSPKLLDVSTKYAIKYPKLKILNCSLNTSCKHVRTYYGRLHEAKFLIGAVAGIMSPTNKIGYIADYPIYGVIANINAFALGAKMVNPNVKIYLEWSKLKPEVSQRRIEDINVSFISGNDFIKPEEDSPRFGLYNTKDAELVNLAVPLWNWGIFYEKTVKSILNNAWKQEDTKGKNESINYWWGMSSGMIDVVCSTRLPSGTLRLIELLKKSICSEEFPVFSGTIYSQDKEIHSGMDSITAEEIITMDWLADNVVGMIPTMDDLVEEARKVVQIQGVAKAKGTEEEGGV